jgi:hypothetical protein
METELLGSLADAKRQYERMPRLGRPSAEEFAASLWPAFAALVEKEILENKTPLLRL